MQKLSDFFFNHYVLIFILAALTLPLSLIFRTELNAYLSILTIQTIIGLIAFNRVVCLNKTKQ